MALCIAIYFLWGVFFEKPQTPLPSEAQTTTTTMTPQATNTLALQAHLKTPLSRGQALQATPRILIQTPKVKGSIRLLGGRIDDLTLRQYRSTPDKNSDQVTLLHPEQTKNAYYIENGWLSSQPQAKVPNENTLWTTTDTKLSIKSPVTLRWENGEGLVFTRIISIDEDYLFTIKDQVTNNSGQKLDLQSYALVRRHGLPDTSNYVALHEGVVGYVNNKLEEIKYSDLQEKSRMEFESKGGWFGFTDKYWLTALLPHQKTQNSVHFRHVQQADEKKFQVDFITPVAPIAAGETLSNTVNIFSGPKELNLLDSYETKLGVEHFDLAVDFGWFYFITKPLFYFLSFLQKFLGNLGLAILALTVFLKLIFFPLANKSYRSMARMKKLQPMMEALKEKYGDDKVRFNQELMALYKKEKVNPASGCLPMIIQIPFFFALYKVLFVSIEMRHAPFWGWIQDLSAPDPTTIFNLFGLIAWAPPSFLMIGAWPLIMGATMFLQQRMNPSPADPIQEKMFMIMPIMFTYLLAQFPAGLVIYWAWNNILTILQQWLIMRQNTTNKGKA